MCRQIEGHCGVALGSEKEADPSKLTKADFSTPLLRPCSGTGWPGLVAMWTGGLLVAQPDREVVFAAAIIDEAKGRLFSVHRGRVPEFPSAACELAEVRHADQEWRTLSESTTAASWRPSQKRRRPLRSSIEEAPQEEVAAMAVMSRTQALRILYGSSPRSHVWTSSQG